LTYCLADVDTNAPLSGDFSFSIDFANLDIKFFDSGSSPTSSLGFFWVQATINGTEYGIWIGKQRNPTDSGTYYYDGTLTKYDATVPSSGTLSIERTGTSLVVKRGATTVKTWTGVSTADPTDVHVSLQGRTRVEDGTSTADITNLQVT
jgi:hypothetical protein